MAVLYVTEFSKLGFSSNAGQLVQAPFAPPLADSRVTFTAASTALGVTFSATTLFVMLNTDATCSLAFASAGAAAPTATTSAHRMAANETRFYAVNPGGTLAAIVNT